MKIVVATPILYDAASPFNHLFKDILQGFADAGHRVCRLVATDDLQNTAYTLGVDAPTVEYVPFLRKPATKSNIISRYVQDSLMNICMANRIRKERDADVLFEDVSYSSFWAVRAAKKRGMRVVAMLQDIWPDNAVQSGLIGQGSLLYRYFEIWQRYVYKHADRLICISHDMKNFLVSKGVSPDKIEVIYNWGYSDETVDIPWDKNEFVKKYKLDSQIFYAVYAGNIGRMQNVELIVEAAKRLQGQENIRFLIIGDGVHREKIEETVMGYGLKNVELLPMQPSELATHIYSAAGVNIIPLVPGGVKTALPSKTGVVLSCGQPAIFCFDKSSAFAEMVEAEGCGASVDPTSSDELAAAIVSLAKADETRSRSYTTFLAHFTRSHNIMQYGKSVEFHE